MRAFGDQSPCPEIAIVAQKGVDETRISRLTALFCLEDGGGYFRRRQKMRATTAPPLADKARQGKTAKTGVPPRLSCASFSFQIIRGSLRPNAQQRNKTKCNSTFGTANAVLYIRLSCASKLIADGMLAMGRADRPSILCMQSSLQPVVRHE